MPGPLGIIVLVLGSGGVAGILVGLIAPVINHNLQQRRDRDREISDARSAWVARQREMCTALLDAVIRWNSLLLTFRSLHDYPASRFAMKELLEPELHQLPLLYATVLSFRRELDLEPNAHLQGAVERFGDAAIAYQQALLGPLSAQWNVVQRYIGKTPQDEVSRLSEEYDTRRHELQAAVRGHVAALDKPGEAKPARRLR